MTDRLGVIGVGYEGRDQGAFISDLEAWGVSTLFDVRLTPASRRPGFAKKSLSAALEAVGISYVHLPKLGNPKDNRAGFGASSEDAAGMTARTAYSAIIDGDEARESLKTIAAGAAAGFVAVMCFERSELHCHRKIVLDRVRDLTDD